ncbi:methionine gamma-lyase [Clostridiales bacterium PH28_bin88]|nr:methionine gamma-lyase [Clostridiales bacterium PH28_bin88]
MYFDTLAVRAGQENYDPVTGAIATPIYQTTNYAVANVDEGAARCVDLEAGYIYTRLWNPTQKALEEKVAALEGGEAALATGSGVAAITAFFTEVLKSGDHVVSDGTVYSATQYFFSEILPKFGVEVTFVDTSNPGNVEQAIRQNTRVIYFETPANPTIKLVDIAKVVEIAKGHGIMTAVDSTFASPYLQRPLSVGVDVVIHAATKYLGGHGDVQGGVVIGKKDLIMKIREGTLKNMGGIIDPFAAWLIIRGIKTLAIRMEKHCANAMAVARYLEAHPKVDRVYYPGLPSHPQHELAKRQMSGFGGMIAFEVKGGLEAGKTLLNSVRLCRLAVSLGDADTLIQHAASMTHVLVPREERLKAGITDGLIRLSVGIEDHRDIVADLEQAFKQVCC